LIQFFPRFFSREFQFILGLRFFDIWSSNVSFLLNLIFFHSLEFGFKSTLNNLNLSFSNHSLPSRKYITSHFGVGENDIGASLEKHLHS